MVSNIVLILANAYEKFENDIRNSQSTTNNTNQNNNKQSIFVQIKDYWSKNKIICITLMLLLISVVVFGLALFFEWSNILIGCSFLSYSISIFFIVSKVDKGDVENYLKNKNNYYDKIKTFKDKKLEQEFNIDTKSKLDHLLKQCDETSKDLKENNKMIKNGSDLWKNIFLPIVTFGAGAILKLDNISKQISWKIIASGIILSIIFLVMMIGAYIILKVVLDRIFNSHSNRINKLKNVLNDIYLVYYSNN